MGRSSKDRERRQRRDSSPSQYDTPVGFDDVGTPRDQRTGGRKAKEKVGRKDDVLRSSDDASAPDGIESTGFTVTGGGPGGCLSTYPVFPGRYCRAVPKPAELDDLNEYTWWSFVAAVNEELRNHTFMTAAVVFVIAFYLTILGSVYAAWTIKGTAGGLLVSDTAALAGAGAVLVVLVVASAITYHRHTQELHQGLARIANQWSEVFMREGFDVEFMRVRKSFLLVFSWEESRLVFRRYLPREAEETLETLVEVVVPPKPTKTKASILPPLKLPKLGRKGATSHPTSPQSALDFPHAAAEELLPASSKAGIEPASPSARAKRASKHSKKRFLVV